MQLPIQIPSIVTLSRDISNAFWQDISLSIYNLWQENIESVRKNSTNNFVIYRLRIIYEIKVGSLYLEDA
jgi:hypothetical protein